MKRGPFGFLTVYSDPLDAAGPEQAKAYWVVWKEQTKNKLTKIMEHTITRVEKDGIEVNSGVVHSVKEMWSDKNVDYDHPALRKLKKPGVTEYSATR